jgi:hypothetical protein
MKIEIDATMNERDQLWSVYTMTDPTIGEIIFVGHCKLSDVLKTPDVRGIPQFDPNRLHMLEVISIHRTAAEARVVSSKLITQLNRPKLNQSMALTRHCPIECVETGQRWQNATEVCRQQGVHSSALSNHLNNKPGYKTVSGLTYRRVQFAKPDLRRHAEEMSILPWVATADPETLKVEVWQGISNSKNVIASGDEKTVKFQAYMWLVNNSTTDHAAAFAADHGVY